MSCPPRMLVTIIDTSIGTRIAPELVTLFPTTPCTNTGRKKSASNIDRATPTLAMFENVKMLLFQRRSGSTGSGVCASIHTNLVSKIAEDAYKPMICPEVHAYRIPPHTAAWSAHTVPSEKGT